MTIGLTTSQVNRIGDLLRREEVPTKATLEKLQTFRLEHDQALAFVESILREQLGLQPTSRLKTINTIIEKLRRSRTRLSKMQDVGGVRVVEEMNLREQDQLVERIGREFEEAALIDRRAEPVAGYRAVHLVVTALDKPIEIQVRTALQDAWAQTFEKIADHVGREIRYGGSLQDPELLVNGRRASELVERMQALSAEIATIEEMISTADELEKAARAATRQLRGRTSREIFKDRQLARRASAVRQNVVRMREQIRLRLQELAPKEP